ncbi:MAG: PspC domain-containing protein [Bacteroidales bacterium]
MEQSRLYRVIAILLLPVFVVALALPESGRLSFSGFCLLLHFFVGGSGLLVYIILWIAIPVENIAYTNQSNTNTMAEEKNDFEIPDESNEHQKNQQKNNSNLWGGLILITLGVLFLIDRFVPRIDFGDLWPVILIVIGVILISKSYNRYNN